MPTVTLIRSHLFKAIGIEYTDKEFDDLCFEFGVEVDDIETQVIEFTGDGTKEEHVVYKIDIPANRYDLLCLEGFARAIRIFLGREPTPVCFLPLIHLCIKCEIRSIMHIITQCLPFLLTSLIYCGLI
jgi:phenylalanyl-tRNA synthetase beta chain